MEPDASIETSCMIRVAVLPIAAIPQPLFQDYAAMLLSHHTVSLNSTRSFYTEHQKSPFANQPWDSGSLRFKFMLGGSPPSPWEDFQSNRKILAVIGLCHCTSSDDLLYVANQFTAACKNYSSSLVQRCFAFCPGDSQLEEESCKGSNIILLPPADRQTQELHLQTMVQDIAASLLMEFEKWVLQAESGGTILKTPLDSQASLSSEEVIKAKKRRLGRAQKTIGDYCLLAGSPVDANAHYSTAMELTRLTADFFWYAGAMEGSVCALLIDRMGQKDPVLEDEVKYRYNSVILHYRKSFIQDNAQRILSSATTQVLLGNAIVLKRASSMGTDETVIENRDASEDENDDDEDEDEDQDEPDDDDDADDVGEGDEEDDGDEGDPEDVPEEANGDGGSGDDDDDDDDDDDGDDNEEEEEEEEEDDEDIPEPPAKKRK